MYANRDCNDLTFVVTGSELCVFLEIILCHGSLPTGLHNQTWGVPVVYNVMTRNSFAHNIIRKYLHLAETTKFSGGGVN